MTRGGTNAWLVAKTYKQAIRETGWVLCGLCLKPIRYIDDLTVDHILPKALGGTGATDNLQPAHERCNHQKGAKLFNAPGVRSQKNIVGTPDPSVSYDQVSGLSGRTG